ncbi:unnamed protein product [Heligmosomoides polygyrus]|uniref:RNase H domain-containing protein n=1 Tax=Heligmosomoides polygyrus TaxID=6339 RepID=A0A183FDN5_HELPZ|nr:unnamed protein product [Heligmosomoides polygyrus]
MLLCQEAGGINGATASYEGALIAGKLDDATNSSVDNSLKDIHAVRRQANGTCLLAVHKKMAVLITDSEKLLNILGLPMAILSKSVQITFTIAWLEFSLASP